ncbi:right-handed parallel beta-helix repeat-containing protein [Trichormus azollae]|uniref:right-handed parallel beta-helix repeat-containing protein n=1 Tax=Trichormus azollae TaxID=1164 RepID=UPI00325F4E2F
MEGKTANPTIRQSMIHDGNTQGIYIGDNAKAIVGDYEIFANTCPGVTIKNGSNATIRRCKIHDGKSNGVWITDKDSLCY